MNKPTVYLNTYPLCTDGIDGATQRLNNQNQYKKVPRRFIVSIFLKLNKHVY